MDMSVYRYNSMISCAVLEKHALVSFLDSFLENCTSPGERVQPKRLSKAHECMFF